MWLRRKDGRPRRRGRHAAELHNVIRAARKAYQQAGAMPDWSEMARRCAVIASKPG